MTVGTYYISVLNTVCASWRKYSYRKLVLSRHWNVWMTKGGHLWILQHKAITRSSLKSCQG